MDQKQKACIILETIVENESSVKDVSKFKKYLVEKINAVRKLPRPEVLLDLEGVNKYQARVEKLRNKGEII